MEITLKLFFEIKGSELFGGIGKAGYIESGMEISGEDLEQVNLRRYAEEQKKGIAQMCGVTEAKVEIISEERYKICAEEKESSSVAKIVQREENVLQNPLHEVSAGRCRAENTCGLECCCMECREKEECNVRCRGSRGKWKHPEECHYYAKINVFGKILKDIEEAFDENTENIEDANGVHHFVIDSFTARLLAKKSYITLVLDFVPKFGTRKIREEKQSRMILVRSFRGKDKGSCSEIRNRKKKYGGLSDGRKDLYERRIQEADRRIAGKRNTGGDVRWRRIRNWKLSG